MNCFTEALDKFGVRAFREGQKETIDAVMQDKDVVCFLPTSGGKSLCFQLPAMMAKGVTIVICPLIALMNEQVAYLKSIGVGAVALHSESNVELIRSKLSSSSTKLIYLSPERFSQREFLEYISLRRIERVVIDEAHCISTWGSGFRPEYKMIGENLLRLSELCRARLPVSAFTATANYKVVVDIVKSLHLSPKSIYFYRGDVIRKNIYLACEKVDSKRKALLRNLQLSQDECVIVYFSSIKDLSRISDYLRSEGVEHAVFHGKLPQELKNNAAGMFLSGKVKLVLATSAFGMGVNKPDIRQVIHYQIPESLEMYYQQVGRAGRDGNPSKAVLLYNDRDKSSNRFLMQLSFPKYENVWSVVETLKAVSEDGLVDIKESNLVLLSPVALGSHELHSILRYLEAKGMIQNFSEPHGDYLQIELKNINAPLDKEGLNAARDLAIESFDELFSLADSTLCRTFLIQDYFSRKKLPYVGCGHCDNCCEQHKRRDLNRQVLDAKEMRVILNDLISLEVFESDEIKFHWIGQRLISDKSRSSFGFLRLFSLRELDKILSRFLEEGFLASVSDKLVSNADVMKAFLKTKESFIVLVSVGEKLVLESSDKEFYQKLKSIRDDICLELQVSPNAVFNELQLRRIATLPSFTASEMARIVDNSIACEIEKRMNQELAN